MRRLINIVSVYALVWLAGNTAARAAEPAEYRQADTSFYLPGAVLKAEPNAVILTPTEYTQKGDSYFVTLKRHKMPAAVYLEQTKDWLEPITPPSMPASLGVAPDAMQVRAPQGDVQIAPPNSTTFAPATEGAPILNSATIKTGSDGSAVVLFGGVNSVRIAPNSEAMVQQTIAPTLRSTRVDLKLGICFSKVGLRPGEKQDYEVHTPFGVAAAKGTDFVTVALPDRTDVWIAVGTVQFTQPSGEVVGTVKAVKNGLRIIRFPLVTDLAQANIDTAQTMTSALNFIPTVNNNLKTLRLQLASGVKATPQELRWMTYLKTVHALIKLSMVAPPPPPVPPPAPVPVPPPTPVAHPTNGGASTMPGPQKSHFDGSPEQAAASVTTNSAGMPMPMLHATLSPRAMSLDGPQPTELPPVTKTKLAKKKKKLRAQPVILASNPPPPEAMTPIPSIPPAAPVNPPPIMPPTLVAAEKATEPAATKPPNVATTTPLSAKAKKKLAAKQKKKPAPSQAAITATKKPASATTPKTAAITPPSIKPKPAPKPKAMVAKVKKPTPKPVAVATKSKTPKPKPAPKPVVISPKAGPALKAEIATMPAASSPAPTPLPATPPPDHALIVVAGDGSIHFEGKQLSSGRLGHRLSEIAKVAPDCNVTIQGDRASQPGRMGTVLAMCHQAHLHNISIEPLGGGTPISTSPGDTQP